MDMLAREDRVLVFERIFEAPRELVYRLWTEPKHLIAWYGPRGHSLTTCEVDFRVGGKWRFCMDRVAANRSDGITWVWGTYHEIQEPSKLVFSSSMDWHKYETLVTIHFDDLGDGRTRMRFRQEEFRNAPDCMDHNWGWASALDVLGEYLLRMQTAGLVADSLWREPRRDGVSEDYAEAARRAAEERQTMPDAIIPPSAMKDR